jgi:hypothetical protein
LRYSFTISWAGEWKAKRLYEKPHEQVNGKQNFVWKWINKGEKTIARDMIKKPHHSVNWKKKIICKRMGNNTFALVDP